jgi:serralysin
MANFYGDDGSDVSVGATYVDLYGGNGNDLLYGNAIANELYGGRGNDLLTGSPTIAYTGTGTQADPAVYTVFQQSGNDILDGGSDGDALYGADGDDKLYGGEGDDSGAVLFVADFFQGGLYGGLGRDVMWGGGGADWFVFQSADESGSSPTTADVIRDFSREEGDKIDVSGMGDFDFIGKKKFKGDGDAELSFKKFKLSGDVDGDGQRDFMIKLTGVEKLQDSDFIL